MSAGSFGGKARPWLLLMVLGIVILAVRRAPGSSAAKAPDLTAACGTVNPYLAVARFAAPMNDRLDPDAPSVVALRDTPADDLGAQLTLATQTQTGAVFGLAYDAARAQVYASAYHKRGVPFGPSGPGGTYRIDLATGTVRPWVTLPAGPDRHNLKDRDDELAAVWVGRASLGDIDLSEDGSELYAVNAYDGRIYRLAVPDGRILGSFANGGTGESWAGGARPMGLGVWGDQVYHGVVNSGADGGPNEATVYVSGRDGRRSAWVTSSSPGSKAASGCRTRRTMASSIRTTPAMPSRSGGALLSAHWRTMWSRRRWTPSRPTAAAQCGSTT